MIMPVLSTFVFPLTGIESVAIIDVSKCMKTLDEYLDGWIYLVLKHIPMFSFLKESHSESCTQYG